MRVRAVLLAVGLLPCGAEGQSLPNVVYTDFRNGVTDILAVWVSPFRGEGKDYLTAGMVLGGAGLVALLDDGIGEWIHEHQHTALLEGLDPFREGHALRLVDLGGGKHLTTFTVAMYAAGVLVNDQRVRDGAMGCAAADKAGGIPRGYLYKAVARERPLFRDIRNAGMDTVFRRGDPYDIDVPGSDSWFDNSFFGGHGANVMSCASFFNHRFDLGLAEPVIWAVAIGVNVGRMADQRHWASDTVVGAVAGYAVGKYVAERSLERARKRAAADRTPPGGKPPGGGEGSDAGGKASWLGGLYVDQTVSATVVGWRQRF